MSRPEAYRVMRTEAEWRRRLTREQYLMMRSHGTEAPGSCALLQENRSGRFTCAGCELPVYDSAMKFDSGTGWPSFTTPLGDAVGTSVDRSLLFLVRTAVHCSRCGGHLGHVFDDGPPPTGQRHCLNGVALTFRPADGAAS